MGRCMELLLSLDVGTTSVKGVLFDRRGRPVAAAIEEYALDKPARDIVELDCRQYWDGACKVIRHLLDDSAWRCSDIVAVGVTSQGETLIALDASGRPLRPAIVWLDNRSQAQADRIAAEFDIQEVYRTTGQQGIAPTWTATRILWLRENQPEIFREAHKFLLVADYLLYRLTGTFCTDGGLNPSTLYFDITAYRWWARMLQFLGIEAAQLPEVRSSGEIAGKVTPEAASQTGLAAGTPVVTAPMDQICAAVGAGNIAPGMITENTGAALAICATVEGPTYDPQRRVGCFNHAAKGRYVLLPWVQTAGMALRWFRDELGGGLDYDALCREAATVPPGAEGLVFLPYLSGAGCPDMDSRARGTFWRIDLAHRRAHFTRAVLESVAFVLRQNLEFLGALGFTCDEVRCLGGGSRSELWVQIKADMLNLPCVVMDTEESTALGVAILAAVGAGLYPNLPEAIDKMVRVRRRIEPDPDRAEAYEHVYQRYARLHGQLVGLFAPDSS